MKKKLVSLIILGVFTLYSCHRDDRPVQQIDQVIHLYLRDANGKDLLNSKLAGSYQEVFLKDLGGIRDQVPISTFSLQKDKDTLTYLEYTAGAKRNPTDTLNPNYKKYRSDIMLSLRKKAADSVDLDTMVVFYEWTPELFQVSEVEYNGKKVFTKIVGQPNKVSVVK